VLKNRLSPQWFTTKTKKTSLRSVKKLEIAAPRPLSSTYHYTIVAQFGIQKGAVRMETLGVE